MDDHKQAYETNNLIIEVNSKNKTYFLKQRNIYKEKPFMVEFLEEIESPIGDLETCCYLRLLLYSDLSLLLNFYVYSYLALR